MTQTTLAPLLGLQYVATVPGCPSSSVALIRSAQNFIGQTKNGNCQKLQKIGQNVTKVGKTVTRLLIWLHFSDLYDKCCFQDMPNGFRLILNLVPKPSTPSSHVCPINGMASFYPTSLFTYSFIIKVQSNEIPNSKLATNKC